MAVVKNMLDHAIPLTRGVIGAGEELNIDTSPAYEQSLLASGALIVVDPSTPPPAPSTMKVGVQVVVPFETPAEPFEIDVSDGVAGQAIGIDGQPLDVALDSELLADVTTINAAIAAKIPLTQRGAANGVATLDSGSKIPSAQLPSSVDAGSYFAAAATGVAATDRASLQAALNAGVRRVEVRAGNYLIDQSLIVKSNTELVLHRDASITTTVGSNCPVIRNESMGHATNRDSNIAIIGGKIHRAATGGGGGNDYTQNGVVMHRVDGLLIRDLRPSTDAKWAVHLSDVTRFTVDNIDTGVTNSDGVHVNGPASKGVIRNIYGQPGDDHVAIIGYDWTGYQLSTGDVSDILVDGVFTTNGTRDCVQLSAGNGTKMRGVTVRHVRGSTALNAVICADSPVAVTPETANLDVDDLLIEDVRVTTTTATAAVLLGPKTGGNITVRGVRWLGSAAKGVQVQNTDNTAVIKSLIVDDFTSNINNSQNAIEVSAGATVNKLTVTNSRLTGLAAASGSMVNVAGLVTQLDFANCKMVNGLAMAYCSNAVLPAVSATNCRVEGTSYMFRPAHASDTTILNVMVSNCTIDGGSTFLAHLFNTQGVYVYGGPVNLVNGGRMFNRSGSQTMRANGVTLPVDGTKVTPTTDDVYYNTAAGQSPGVGLLVYDGSAYRRLRDRAPDSDITSLLARVATLEAPTFNPTSLAGLAAWYKADAGALDGSDVLITVDATAIKTWQDQSGNAQHLVQATGSKQPLYKTAIQASKPVVRFDGTDDSLRKTFTLNQPEHVFVVCRANGARVGNDTVFDGGSAINTMRYYRSTSTHMATLAGSSVSPPGADVSPEAWHVHSILFSGTSSQVWVDGILGTGTLGTSTPGASNAGGLILGIAGNQTTDPMNVDIAEVLIYSAALSAVDRARVEAYLKYRWATP